MIAIKLGGSVLTKKNAFETLNERNLIHFVRDFPQHKRAFLCHGAGSFGHFQAKKHGFTKEHRPLDSFVTTLGFADIRRSVTKLNHIVVSALVGECIPAVGIPNLDSNAIEMALKFINEGILPVAHGGKSRRQCFIIFG